MPRPQSRRARRAQNRATGRPAPRGAAAGRRHQATAQAALARGPLTDAERAEAKGYLIAAFEAAIADSEAALAAAREKVAAQGPCLVDSPQFRAAADAENDIVYHESLLAEFRGDLDAITAETERDTSAGAFLYAVLADRRRVDTDPHATPDDIAEATRKVRLMSRWLIETSIDAGETDRV